MTVRNGLDVQLRLFDELEAEALGKLEVGMRALQFEGVRKLWAVVTTPRTGSAIAFQDLYTVNRYIVACEIAKYAGLTTVDEVNAAWADRYLWDRWARMPRDFMLDTFEYGATYEDLRVKHKLPR